MRRSLALLALASAVACSEHSSSSVTGNDGATNGSDTVVVSANVANVGPVIPPNFMGLAFDPYTLQVTIPQNQVPSTALVNLLKALGTGVLRINAGDYCHPQHGESWWTPGTRDTRSDGCTVLIGADFDRLFQICAAANWTVIFGVNFAAALPDTFAAEAAFIHARGGSLLTAIEIGNEPDLYALSRVRASSYDFAAYAVEVNAFLAAMAQRAPGVPIAAPATANVNDTAWFRQAIAQNPSRFALATQHMYATANDASIPVGSFIYTSIPHLLSDTLRTVMLTWLKTFVADSRPFSVPTRLTETNVTDGVVPGVNDVFASALWGLDHLFLAAEAGLAGVHIFAGSYFTQNINSYSPFTMASDGTVAARPLLYGMLAFQDAARGQVLTLTTTNTRRWNFSAHGAVTAGDGTMRFALVNDDTAAVPVRIVVPNATTVTVRRLVAGTSAAPLSDSTDVTYAGAKVTTLGTFTPVTSEVITPTAGTFVVNVPPTSAAIVVVTTK
jgi:hypothetical protein